MPDELIIWLYGQRTATIERRPNGRLRLTYTREVLDQYELGTALLSLNLIVQPEPFSHGTVVPFLDGLLPEEGIRQAVAAELDVRAKDTFSLIEALGRDSAGALVILPDGETPAPSSTERSEPIDESQLRELVANLPHVPLGIDANVRLSLAGVQSKLVLCRRVDGGWGRPVGGAPSTHIIKPEHPRLPGSVENEAFCMRVLQHLGCPVANVDILKLDPISLLVVERYDRVVHATGEVERIHQEDFCQVLGLAPDKKYEDAGGPSLRRIAQTIESVAQPGSREALLRHTVVNVLLGNTDAHAKNFSLIHDRDGTLRLAPAYDVLSIRPYGFMKVAMRIDKLELIDRVTIQHILNEAVSWGLSRDAAQEVAADLIQRLPDAVSLASSEIPDAPASVLDALDRNLTKFRENTA